MELSAHYLRTPFTIISGGAELLSAIPARAELGNKLSTPVKRLGTVIEDILDEIKQNKSIQTMAATVSSDDARRGALGSPLFWLPMVIVGTTVLTADALFHIYKQLSTSTITYLEQLLAYLLAGLLLYGSIRSYLSYRRHRAATQQLMEEQSNLDEARNRFIDRVSQQLRSEVNAIEQPVLAEHSPEGTEHVLKGLTDFKIMVDNFALLMAIKSTANPAVRSAVGLKAVVSQAASELGDNVAKKKLSLEDAQSDATASTDEILLSHVVGTVLDNAVKYAPENSQIRSDIERQGSQALLTIHNDGPGIPEDKMAHLFQPFSRAEGNALDFSQQGMGFSLYLDKIIMDYLDGSISASSEHDKGMTISINIPASA
jgi:signal transduction histidine kinase